MKIEFDGKTWAVCVSAEGVEAGAGSRPGLNFVMPAYVRIGIEAYPLGVNFLLSPEQAKAFAHQIYAEACKLDAEPELLAFDLERVGRRYEVAS